MPCCLTTRLQPMFFLGFVKQRLDALGENVFLFLQSVNALVEEFAFFRELYDFFRRSRFVISEFVNKCVERRKVFQVVVFFASLILIPLPLGVLFLVDWVLNFFGFVNVADNPLHFVVEKLLVSLIELGDSDAFLLTDVEFLLQGLIFCHRYGCVKWHGVIRVQVMRFNHLLFHFVLAKFPWSHA